MWRQLSDEVDSAVDREGGPGDVGVGHQEDDGVGDLVGLGNATERDALGLRRDDRSRRSPAMRVSNGVSTMPGRMMLRRSAAISRATTRARISAAPAAAATIAPPRRGRATPAPVQMVIEPSVIVGVLVLADVERAPQAVLDRIPHRRRIDCGDLAIGVRPGEHHDVIDVLERSEQRRHRSVVGDVQRRPRTAPPSWSSTAASRASSRPTTVIRAPASCASAAVARPMPDVPPITTTSASSSDSDMRRSWPTAGIVVVIGTTTDWPAIAAGGPRVRSVRATGL